MPCLFCLNERSKMYTCKQCENANYCSELCQRSHWKTHKTVCTPKINYSIVVDRNDMLKVVPERKYSNLLEQVVKFNTTKLKRNTEKWVRMTMKQKMNADIPSQIVETVVDGINLIGTAMRSDLQSQTKLYMNKNKNTVDGKKVQQSIDDVGRILSIEQKDLYVNKNGDALFTPESQEEIWDRLSGDAIVEMILQDMIGVDGNTVDYDKVIDVLLDRYFYKQGRGEVQDMRNEHKKIVNEILADISPFSKTQSINADIQGIEDCIRNQPKGVILDIFDSLEGNLTGLGYTLMSKLTGSVKERAGVAMDYTEEDNEQENADIKRAQESYNNGRNSLPRKRLARPPNKSDVVSAMMTITLSLVGIYVYKGIKAEYKDLFEIEPDIKATQQAIDDETENIRKQSEEIDQRHEEEKLKFYEGLIESNKKDLLEKVENTLQENSQFRQKIIQNFDKVTESVKQGDNKLVEVHDVFLKEMSDIIATTNNEIDKLKLETIETNNALIQDNEKMIEIIEKNLKDTTNVFNLLNRFTNDSSKLSAIILDNEVSDYISRMKNETLLEPGDAEKYITAELRDTMDAILA